MKFTPTTDDGGSAIIKYKLMVDEGNNLQSSFSEITSYDGFATPYTVTIATDSLQNGSIYRFAYIANNIYGDSDLSLELLAGLGNVPPAPQNLRVQLLPQMFDSLIVKWDIIETSDLPIRGYKLYMDDGLRGEMTVIYDGSYNPQLNEMYVNDLIPGRTYVF